MGLLLDLLQDKQKKSEQTADARRKKESWRSSKRRQLDFTSQRDTTKMAEGPKIELFVKVRCVISVMCLNHTLSVIILYVQLVPNYPVLLKQTTFRKLIISARSSFLFGFYDREEELP